MITATNRKWNGLVAIAGFVTIAAMTACNNSDSSGTSSAGTDTVSTAASDTTAVKPVAKSRKGRASVSMMGDNADNNKTTNIKDKDGAYTKVDVVPVYPGGESALQQFVENNVSYPQPAMDGNVEGTVKVSFVVDEKGMVTKPQVTGVAPGSGLDEEALRVVKQMPKWTPGTIKGKTVKTRLELPITFKLSET